jgi:mono/diheme cytochrome c family protein
MLDTQNISAFVGFLLALVSSVALPAENVDMGRVEYTTNCLNCHGQAGDGNGPYASLLNKTASDLTQLAKSNKGVFPFARVYEVIDGRQAVKAHGQRDMPIWGNDYRIQSGEKMFEVNYEPEIYVRTRILALIEYLSRLQK